MTRQEWSEFCYRHHDVVCNQKYDTVLPYSQHLKYVEAQVILFKHLLQGHDDILLALCGAVGHDLIEDARVTYNDIVLLMGSDVAEIIYCCTEQKGRNRLARHSKEYYLELAENHLAVFVKLCDIIANVKYSILTNSGMYAKHKAEHEKTKEYLVTETKNTQYKPMIEYLDKLFELQ